LKKLSERLFFYLNGLFAFLMLLSVLAMYIQPDFWIIPSFLALTFPFLLFINLVFLVIYVYYRKKYFLLPLAAIILAYPALTNTFSFNLPVKSADDEFRLMSYNVRLFNLYDWIEDIHAADEIMAVIKRENPDVLCMQEFYSNSTERNLIDEIMETGDFLQYYCPGYENGKSFGSIIFSRFPIVNYGSFQADGSDNTFVFADIEAGDRTLRFYSLHLASLYLSNSDYDFIDNIADNNRSETVESLNGILSKMSFAYNKRLSEISAITRHSNETELPVILCGDFNDVPVSYAYRYFRSDYKDAFKTAGFGIGNTYIRRLVRFRIDYVFYNEPLKAVDFNVIRKKYSDHYPVVVDFGF
jgi:endonuclease/exonuclease/phosphatase family metal-dependent hydrolase